MLKGQFSILVEYSGWPFDNLVNNTMVNNIIIDNFKLASTENITINFYTTSIKVQLNLITSK
jgi:hypothetical protein